MGARQNVIARSMRLGVYSSATPRRAACTGGAGKQKSPAPMKGRLSPSKGSKPGARPPIAEGTYVKLNVREMRRSEYEATTGITSLLACDRSVVPNILALAQV